MGYVWTFIVLFVFANRGIIAETDDQSVYFTSWKEPPINSSNGEGTATVIVKENGKPENSTGIVLQALGGSGNVSYIISRQPNPMYFSVGGPSNDEVMISTPIDFEKVKNVTVMVIAFDEGNPQKTGSALMTIIIGDVNDNAPQFEKSLYTTPVSELTEIGKPFITVSAFDVDGTSPNNELSYSIAGRNKNSRFEIDSLSGNISVARQLVWVENSRYELVVVATDGGTDPHPLSGTATVQVNIDKAETLTSWKEPPISAGIGHGTATVRVKENSKTGTSTGITLQALGGNGTVTYTVIDQQEPRYFSIGGPHKDEIIVAAPVDIETENTVTVTVQAEDSGEPAKTGRAVMTILIDDVNDNAPVFQKAVYTMAVLEDTPLGSLVLSVMAMDKDVSSPNNVVKYSILDGNTNNDFNISPTTGAIKLANQLKSMRTSNYQLTVLAVDGGTDSSPLTGTATVSIVIERDDGPSSATPSPRTGQPSAAAIPSPCVLTIFTNMIFILIRLRSNVNA